MSASRIALALALVASSFSFQPVQAFEFSKPEGECDSGWVSGYLKTKTDALFRIYNEKHVVLNKISNPQMTYERKRDDTHDVGRKFCHATALMHEAGGHWVKRDIWYVLDSPMGFAGTPKQSGIEFCISGLDPWHVYGKDCSTLRNATGW